MKDESLENIILFDGVCNFCNKWVNIVISHDPHAIFKFAPLQSEIGKKLLQLYALKDTGINSIVLIQKNKAYTKSSAVLYIAKKLKGFYPLLFVFILIPAFIRDRIYNFIAQHRYKWFGKKEACISPSFEVRSRFLN